MSINEVQHEIEKEIAELAGDAERIAFYLITLGRRNPGLHSSDKTEANAVKGCHTKIWFRAVMQENRVSLAVDSNTIIIKGLGCLLIRLFDGQAPEEILHADLHFLNQDSVKRFLGGNRSDGLNNMIRHLKLIIGQFETVQRDMPERWSVNPIYNPGQ